MDYYTALCSDWTKLRHLPKLSIKNILSMGINTQHKNMLFMFYNYKLIPYNMFYNYKLIPYNMINISTLYLFAAWLGKLDNIKNIEPYVSYSIIEYGWLIAAQYGHITIIKYLRNKYKNILYVRNICGYNVGTIAAWNGFINIMEYLPEQYYDIELLKLSGQSHVINYLKNKEYMRKHKLYLKLNLRSSDIVLEILKGYTSCKEEINKEDMKKLAFFNAAKNGHANIIKWLFLEFGAHNYEQDVDGNTILMIAARYNRLNIIKCLYKLTYIYNREIFNNSSESAYIIAYNNKYTKIATFLRNNYDVIPKYKIYISAVLSAAIYNHVCILEELHRLGCDLSIKTSWGDNAILLSTSAGNLDVIKYLHTVNPYFINSINKYGHNAFMTACYCGHMDIILWLRDKININQVSNTGMNAYHKAAEGGQVNVLYWLHDKINIYSEDIYGNNAFNIACNAGKLSVIKYLFSIEYICNYELADIIDCTTEIKEYICGHRYWRYLTYTKTECSICYDDSKPDNIYITCIHGHEYHLSCQVKTNADICVYCRKSLKDSAM